MPAQVNIVGTYTAQDRIIDYDPGSLIADFSPPEYFPGELWAINDEIVELIGAPAFPEVGWVVNRGMWFTTPAAIGDGAVARFIDVQRQSISASPGALVELFKLDASGIGDDTSPHYFVNGFMTAGSLTDLLVINKKTNLADTAVWVHSGGSSTVTAGAVAPDGTLTAFEMLGTDNTNASISSASITIPNDGNTYHFKGAIRVRGPCLVQGIIQGGTAVDRGFVIDIHGNTYISGLTGVSLPANLVVEQTERGYFLFEFDVANNHSGNTGLAMEFTAGYVAPTHPAFGDATAPGHALITTPQIFGPPGAVYWGGIQYLPMPIITSGFEMSIRGALPTPRLKVANNIVGNLAASLVDSFDDVVGAKIYRYRTFAKHLDTGTEPDKDKHFKPDVYVINRKVSQNKLFIEWELSTAIDQQGSQLPGRTLLRDYCPWQYRRFIPDVGFDYTNVDCPYTGTNLFDANDNAVSDGALDHCSKRLTGCLLRFGPVVDLPYGGFPGVSLWR